MPNHRLLASLALVLVASAAAHAAEKPPLVHVKGPQGYRLLSASYFHDGLVAVTYHRDGAGYREGFLDAKGGWAVPARYEDAGNFFRDGLARVKSKGRWGYVDGKGEPKFDGDWAYCNDFQEGRAVVVTPGVMGFFRRYGYIDTTGKVVIEPKFNYASDFQRGVAAVQVGERFGLIGKAGEVIVPVENDGARHVGEDVFSVHKGDKTWFVDPKGQRLPMPETQGDGFFDGGFGILTLAGDPPDLRTIVDRQGKIHGAKRRAFGNDFREGLVNFKEGKKAGYMRGDGTVAIPPKFDEATMFSDGLAAVKVGAKWGFIDHTGTLVIPARFDYAGRFAEHLAGVREGARAGFIDRAGEFRIDLGESKDFWAF